MLPLRATCLAVPLPIGLDLRWWTALLLVPPGVALLLLILTNARLTVLYDGACGMCRRGFAVMKALDWTRSLEGMNLRDWPAVHARFPHLDEAGCVRDMHAVNRGGVARSGFAAYRAIAWRLPLLAPLAWLLYVPPVPYLGRKCYRRIADRRVTTGCGDECCPVHRSKGRGD